jgi:hypothetical protein
MARLRTAWAEQRRQVFDEAMTALADSLGRLGAARVALDDRGGLRGTLRQLGAALGMSKDRPAALDRAEQDLAQLIDVEARSSTDTLIRLHGLSGDASGAVLHHLGALVVWRRKVGEAPAALIGGMLSGAATGLAAGGLTLGGGMIAGGLIGALGAAGVARGLNVVRGTDRSWVSLTPEALQALLQAALLRYLAVAHFGRGRGHWRDGEAPPHWADPVRQALALHSAALQALWQGRSSSFDNPGEAQRLALALRPILQRSMADCLALLYPGAWDAAPNHPVS